MTDKELLEAAAKAAGLVVVGIDDSWVRVASEGCKGGLLWSPLVDDGDALRLAVKLHAFLDLDSLCAQVSRDRWFGGGDDQDAGMDHSECDPYAATRRAIVRAAAAMAGDS